MGTTSFVVLAQTDCGDRVLRPLQRRPPTSFDRKSTTTTSLTQTAVDKLAEGLRLVIGGCDARSDFGLYVVLDRRVARALPS